MLPAGSPAVLRHLGGQRGAQFEPRLVDVFVRLLEREGLREQLA
jgi:response regulator RpfG family c-di-GMP phosphodiesterase